MLLSFITLINAKTSAYELNSNFKSKSEMNTMSFCEFRSEQTKQAQALEVTFSRKSKSYVYITHKSVSTIY